MKFSILINTCDKYHFLWNDFVELFNKYWDHNIECDKYFLTETITKKFDNFEWITAGTVPYSQCIKKACEAIDTDYILWLQDDYFLRKTIYKEEMDVYFNLVKDFSINRFGIHENSSLYNSVRIKNNLYKMNQFTSYSISMQASIWNKKFLESCLVENENPWEFEINGSLRLNQHRPHNIWYSSQDNPWYLEAMRKGKFTEDYFKIKEEENL